MKSVEFMIGDWIEIFPDYCQVLSIGKKGRIYTTTVSNYKVDEKSSIGIYITDSFLETNGFYISFLRINKIATNYSNGLDIAITARKNKDGVYNGKWCLRITNRTGVERICCYIQFVHELQHALRLIGLNDMADNFKMEGGQQ